MIRHHRETLTALFERIPGETFRTEADRIAVVVLAHRIQAAWIRNARVRGQFRASDERIPFVSWHALALRLMIHGQTVRVVAAAGLQARVDALSVETIAVLAHWTVLVVLANVFALVLCKNCRTITPEDTQVERKRNQPTPQGYHQPPVAKSLRP